MTGLGQAACPTSPGYEREGVPRVMEANRRPSPFSLRRGHEDVELEIARTLLLP